MRYQAYYVIRGRPALAEALAGADADSRAELQGPLLISNEEGGRTARTAVDTIAEMKALFAGYARHVLGAPPALFDGSGAVEAFDRHWTIERFDGVDYESEVMVTDLEQTAPDAIPPALRRPPRDL